MKLIEEIKSEWKQYKYQVVGLVLLLVAVALGCIEEWGIGFLLLVGILVEDIWLILTKQDTITKWIRRQLPSVVDKAVMILMFIIVAKVAGWGAAYWLTIGTILGHLKWSD